VTDLSKDRGFLLGDGVFDTLVAFNGIPFQADAHLARLVGQAAQIGIELDGTAIRESWQRSLAGNHPSILRTTVTRGTSERGLWPEKSSAPTCAVAASPWSPTLIDGSVALVTATIRRNDQSPTSRLKSTSYLDNILAAREAKQRGADDALLLNTAGAVACTTIANVFALRGDRLVTPPLTDGVLAGTMRALVLELAAKAGLSVAETTMSLADFVVADVAFVTNSVRFLRPVSSHDGRRFPERLPEPFRALRRAVADRVADETFFRPSWD